MSRYAWRFYCEATGCCSDWMRYRWVARVLLWLHRCRCNQQHRHYVTAWEYKPRAKSRKGGR